MKKKIYLETTVVSYYTARPSRDLLIAAHQTATRELWPKLIAEYDTYVSALVYEEAKKGDPEQAQLRINAARAFEMLQVDPTAKTLASKLIDGKAIPAEYSEDALHLAIAAVNGIHALITWNFAHLNNPFTRILARRIISDNGYECPEVSSPDELLEVKNEGSNS